MMDMPKRDLQDAAQGHEADHLVIYWTPRDHLFCDKLHADIETERVTVIPMD